MRISSIDIPQADRLERVIEATVAVANGAHTDLEISGAVGHERDGRYYRRAAQNLGFISNDSNYSQLTEKGRQFLRAPQLSNPLLLSSVLEQRIFQRFLPFLEVHPEGVTRAQIVVYLQSLLVGELAQSTIERRTSSLLNWASALRLIREQDHKIFLSNAVKPNLPIVDIKDVAQPILPKAGDLQEYEIVKRRMDAASETVSFYVDLAKRERANSAHTELVNLVASRIKDAGGIAKSSRLVDLATNLDEDYIFEMKSSTPTNIRSQVRRGISQLYEYRYLQNIPGAKLVLVLENSLGVTTGWMHDYLEIDREILLIWDGNDRLYGSDRAEQSLPFLNLNV